ncbi:uncharacterized membrane protein YjjP (DUF1212 family) [Pedobacter cryoconitis]|uniref:hypothetical protein n=1 Tax=Pedobacter cryoconitis TaxID=188932 RepID=UPI00160983DF|nr:hypothetical protein [Pedobacter cryoconitis]MBB6273517.1 uncharacterized membrane protein YjjP (DUF1212 family) [Pedobacter cryoconitis]
MLRTLSYLNLIFAVLYFLAYLLNGNRWVVLGLLITVVFNWMILRDMETEQLKWSFFQWLTGIITVLFASWLGYSTILLLMNTIEYHYYPAETVVLIISGLLFSFTIFLQLLISLYKKNR